MSEEKFNISDTNNDDYIESKQTSEKYTLKYFRKFNKWKTNTSLSMDVKKSIEKGLDYLKQGNLQSPKCKNLQGVGKFKRVAINKNDRIIFLINKKYILICELILNHKYSKSKFISGKKAEALDFTEESINIDIPNIDTNDTFTYQDKPIFFHTIQNNYIECSPPFIINGSAGSGKTSIAVEIINKNSEEYENMLYISLSKSLVNVVKNKCLKNNVTCITFDDFTKNFMPQKQDKINSYKFKIFANKNKIKEDIEKLYEEIRGVITGGYTEGFLSKNSYTNLSLKKSIFKEKNRKEVYDCFEKYQKYMKHENCYDEGISIFNHLDKIEAKYDFIVIDEIQDLTNIQIYSIMKSLKESNKSNFVLTGDTHQVIYPNFFSFTNLKEMLYKVQRSDKIEINTLTENYRNGQNIIKIANKILYIKTKNFSHIDKESSLFVDAKIEKYGKINILRGNNINLIKKFNDKIKDSVKFAIVVLDEKTKKELEEAKTFSTDLIFTIQEIKGLEYDNIILYNFVSKNKKLFDDMAKDIDIDEMEKCINDKSSKFSRHKDKTNRDLENYKILINGLYVACTRGINNIYFIENDYNHEFLKILKINEMTTIKDILEKRSTYEEIEMEIKRLRDNGLNEQANNLEYKNFWNIDKPNKNQKTTFWKKAKHNIEDTIRLAEEYDFKAAKELLKTKNKKNDKIGFFSAPKPTSAIKIHTISQPTPMRKPISNRDLELVDPIIALEGILKILDDDRNLLN